MDVFIGAVAQQGGKRTFLLTMVALVLVAVILIIYLNIPRKFMNAVTVKDPVQIASSSIAVYSPLVDRAEQNRRDYTTDLKLPSDEMALANFHILGCRLAGFIGPESMYGVFWESDATLMALKAGARVFVLDIDSLRGEPTKPVLVCAAANGNQLSLNRGSIRAVAEAIANFKKRSDTIDPIILYLNVIMAEGARDTLESLKFMSAIANELKPVHSYILRQTERGVYTQQGMEEKLFLQPITEFEKKVLVLTNMDTTAFRNPPPTFSVDPASNLDNIVHARIYSHTITEDRKVKPVAFVDTPDFYRNLPRDDATQKRYTDETRHAWSIAVTGGMEDGRIDGPMDAATMKTAFGVGVQCVPVNIFKNLEDATSSATNSIYGSSGGIFTVKSYVPKEENLRYKEPAPVILSPPSTKLNSNGGTIVMPV